MSNQARNNESLFERILQIDHIQARRFSKLEGIALKIPTEGIERHFKACLKMDVPPDAAALREIIDDSLKGKRHYI